MACDFLLKWPDLASLQRAKPDTVRRFYHAHSVRRSDVIEQRLEAIADAKPLIEDAAILEACRMTVQSLATLLRKMVDVIAGFEKRIAEVFASHPDATLFDSLPGAGKALAPRLLCAFGADRDRFSHACEIQTYSGIAPVTKRSGKQCLVQRRWAAPKFLKQTFHEFALHSIGQCRWARAYYTMQKSRGKKHHAAVRALAFKWIRVLFECWKNHRHYDEAYYLEQLSRRHSPLLAHMPPAV
jgi:transposase